MFKLKKLNIILGIFILLLIGVATVSHAEETQRADMSNIDFEWTGYNETNHKDLSLKVKNVNFIEKNKYKVYVSHNQNEQVNIETIEEISDDGAYLLNDTIYGLDNIIQTNGDIYIWICEWDSNSTPQMVVSAKKVNRLEQISLGKRFAATFHSDDTYINCWEVETERKVNVKIGTVSDKSILNAIKNNKNDCMQKLLTYSKSKKPFYTGTLQMGTTASITNSINLVDGEYYYAYLELENKDEKYFPVEDVIFLQGYISSISGEKDLLEKINWNALDNDKKNSQEQTKTPEEDKTQKSDDKETDNTTATNKLPYTGMPCIIISSVALIISTLIIAVKLKKYKGI